MTVSSRSTRVLAVGAHPDDIELGAGATLLQLQKAGWELGLLVITNGSLGGNADVRKDEQNSAAEKLGARLYWGELQDGEIQDSTDTVRLIERHVREFRPDLVFVHWPEDTHQDHRNLARATKSACRSIRNFHFYEGPSSEGFEPTNYVDFNNDHLERKMDLLSCHHSQMNQLERTDFLRWVQDTARLRAIKRRCDCSEVFRPAWANLFLSLSPESVVPDDGAQDLQSTITPGTLRSYAFSDDAADSQQGLYASPDFEARRIVALGDRAIANWTRRTVEDVLRDESANDRATRIKRLEDELARNNSSMHGT